MLRHVLLVKGMIAERDHIRPRLKQRSGMTGAKPHAIGRVLAIDHHEIEPPRRAQPPQLFGDRLTAGPPHHIAQE